jgi:hypothetical protein
MPKRWVVERSFAWLEKCRRLWKNCERKLETSQTTVRRANAFELPASTLQPTRGCLERPVDLRGLCRGAVPGALECVPHDPFFACRYSTMPTSDRWGWIKSVVPNREALLWEIHQAFLLYSQN